MFLLRIKTRHWEQAQLFEDFAIAAERAAKHVGDHDPEDGCSSEPIVSNRKPGTTIYIWRNTSFGLRQARVDPVSTEAMGVIGTW